MSWNYFGKKSRSEGMVYQLPLEELTGEGDSTDTGSRELRVKFGNGHKGCRENPGSFVLRQCSSNFNVQLGSC